MYRKIHSPDKNCSSYLGLKVRSFNVTCVDTFIFSTLPSICSSQAASTADVSVEKKPKSQQTGTAKVEKIAARAQPSPHALSPIRKEGMGDSR